MTDSKTAVERVEELLIAHGADYRVELTRTRITLEPFTRFIVLNERGGLRGTIDVYLNGNCGYTWQEERLTPEQAIAATLGETRTRDDIEADIDCYRAEDCPDYLRVPVYRVRSWLDRQAAITRREIEAEMGAGECESFTLPEPDGWYKCPDCGCVVGYTELYGGGWSIMMDDYQIPFNACPKCGKAVKR